MWNVLLMSPATSPPAACAIVQLAHSHDCALFSCCPAHCLEPEHATSADQCVLVSNKRSVLSVAKG